MKHNVKNTALLGLCTALALILAYVEVLLPPLLSAVPGIKMGLPNVILIFLLYRKDALTAAGVSLARILLVALLFGNGMSLLYSLAGGALSLGGMSLLKRMDFLSATGVSVAGGVLHNVGQILMAMLLLDTTQIGYYMVVLAATGIAAGLCVGLAGALLIRKIPAKLF